MPKYPQLTYRTFCWFEFPALYSHEMFSRKIAMLLWPSDGFLPLTAHAWGSILLFLNQIKTLNLKQNKMAKIEEVHRMLDVKLGRKEKSRSSITDPDPIPLASEWLTAVNCFPWINQCQNRVIAFMGGEQFYQGKKDLISVPLAWMKCIENGKYDSTSRVCRSGLMSKKVFRNALLSDLILK